MPSVMHLQLPGQLLCFFDERIDYLNMNLEMLLMLCLVLLAMMAELRVKVEY